MPRSIRVVLAPLPTPVFVADEKERANAVTGLRVSFEMLGRKTTLATRAPQPAKLTFHLRTFLRVRTETPSFEKLATLTGKLELTPGGSARFTADTDEAGDPKSLLHEDPSLNGEPPAPETDPDVALEEEASDPPPKRPRMLDLVFDTGGFAGIDDPLGRNARLLLPDDVNRAHFLEIGIDLEIAGTTESAIEANDVLDVRITDDTPGDAPHYELQLVDEVGEFLRGVPLTLQEGDNTFSLRTDDKGKIFQLPVSGTKARVSFSDPQQLKDLLKALWDRPRGKPRFKPGADTISITPRDFANEIEVTTDAPVLVCIHPHVVLARIQGSFFDVNKSFLLPSALDELPKLDEFYQQNANSKLLIVGHTDTTADKQTNDPLSLERAESMLAYVKDDVQKWLSRYEDTSIPAKRRWGHTEDLLMLRARKTFVPKATEDEEIRDFQTEQQLGVDGTIGKETRRRLIELYMDRDGTTLPKDIQPTTHGCGENFPLDELDEDIDPLPIDGQEDLSDRRVELFFFDGEFGIQPPPPGKNSKPGSPEYPEWRRRSQELAALVLNTRTVRLFLLDSRYQRMKSAPYELVAGGVVRTKQASDEGLLEELEVPLTDSCEISWGSVKSNFDAPVPTDPLYPLRREVRFEYFNVVNLKVQDQVDNDLLLRREARARLDNMGHSTERFNEDFRAHRERYELSPADAPFARDTFDELKKIHFEGTEAPLPNSPVDGLDNDPELFENDGLESIDLTLVDDAGKPLADEQVQLAGKAGVIRVGRTDAEGRISFDGLDDTETFQVILPDLDASAFRIAKRETSNG